MRETVLGRELRDQRFADGSLAVSAKFGAADLSAVAGVQELGGVSAFLAGSAGALSI